jgi:UDP-glucose 4-epimerase
MTVLLIGFPGFVSTHLAQEFISHKLKVITIGRSRTKIFATKHFVCDVSDYSSVSKIIKSVQPDWIIYIASENNSIVDSRLIDKSFQTTVTGSTNVLESIRQYSPKSKTIFLSSRQEYGKVKSIPVDENTPTKPLSIYGVHKKIATEIFLIYSSLFGLKTAVFRISNLYGPLLTFPKDPALIEHQSHNILLSFFYKALQGKTIVLFGKGNQLRDYLYIDDFCKLVYLFLKKDKGWGKIYNIGYGKGTSLKQAADIIARATGAGVKSIPWPENWKKVETGSYVSDISRIKRITNWKPTTTFEQGVLCTIKNLFPPVKKIKKHHP